MKIIIKISLTIQLLIIALVTAGQDAQLNGVVINGINNEPVPFSNVVIYNTTIGTVTDVTGEFSFNGLEPGYVQIQVSSIGFEPFTSEKILITNARISYLEIKLNESTTELEEVNVKASPFKRSKESPLSLRSIGIAEIEKNPGGNRDISKVIQSLPGVGGTVSFRNDVIVRGGGPSENRFYLDGVEIPNLNHFATQGASGGPVGIINVDFVRQVDFYSGAFPASKGNALSSVLSFKQVDGNKDKLKYRATIGASDLALTVDGPLADNTSMVFSVRRSYLQFLFSAIGLPFLPTYNDAQFKIKSRLTKKDEITFIGLGAVDQFDLNLDADETEEQQYILGYLPVYEQWNYTIGGVYKHYREHGYHTLVVSRNHLNNTAYKYLNNVEDASNLIYDYHSDEIETKIRYENDLKTKSKFDINYGAGAEYAEYYNRTFQLDYANGLSSEINYQNKLGITKWDVFGQVSKSVFNNRLNLSLGLRADANNYSNEMNNLLKQLSPRFSLNFPIAEKWALNFNTGRFYQLPAYTTLGYANTQGDLINKQNGVKYIAANHIVGGVEYLPNKESKITVEGFYKHYSDYPFSVNDSVALASKGGDFGTVGDEKVLPTGKGRAYGMELYMRHTNVMGANVLMSYTWVRSEFQDFFGEYIPTAWDNKHLFNLTVTRSFKNNWDLGFKYRFTGGSPYTPDDPIKSGFVQAWDAQQRAYPDYGNFNSMRTNVYNQLDVRVDKSYYFKKWSLMVYFDVQNVLNQKIDTPDILTVATDAQGNKIIENPTAAPEDQRYQMRYIKTDGSGTVLPTIGIMVEF